MFEAHFSENGEYVLHSDYAALASEKEVETRATFDAIRTITQLRDDYADLAAENERLKALIDENLDLSKRNLGKTDALRIERDTLAAENERLRKAGDALVETVKVDDCWDSWDKAIIAWLAAKEGRDAK
jgi:hypothetical protein